MSEPKKAGATSGQKVPKSKFRQKSEQERVAESKLRMEKQADKLEKAKERLANQKPLKNTSTGEAGGCHLGV